MISLSRFPRLEQASGWLFDRLGGEYRLRGMRFIVLRELTRQGFRGPFLLGLYEMPERLLLHHLPTDSTLLDLGGCLGVLSCLANRRLRNPAGHVVVEANPALIPVLTANRDRNGARFTVVHGMAGGVRAAGGVDGAGCAAGCGAGAHRTLTHGPVISGAAASRGR